MHLVSTVAAAFLVATLARADATPTARVLSLNPSPADIANASSHITIRAPNPRTNAQRLALGLPPLPPRRRGTPHAPRQSSSPTMQTCKILAKNTDGSDYGFVSNTVNIFGEYGDFLLAQLGGLEVSFSYLPDAQTQLNLFVTSSPTGSPSPYLGAVFSKQWASPILNLLTISEREVQSAMFSLHTYYLTSPGAPAAGGTNTFATATGIDEDIESAIWSYDPATAALTAQWINMDSSAPNTVIVVVQGALALTSDPDAMASVFGPVTVVTFQCVAPVLNLPTPRAV
ncbi:hypothetical protein DFH06DRAFT_1429146 [Mycena polygramma]|nr:hypothetical protein DFH06DRAFT_1429146 [Mycena polygramma]